MKDQPLMKLPRTKILKDPTHALTLAFDHWVEIANKTFQDAVKFQGAGKFELASEARTKNQEATQNAMAIHQETTPDKYA